MSLADRLKSQIAHDGPLTIAQYMTACLHDPQDGYYATRPAIGEGGDFITAPMISQMFGELLGLWALETWSRMGRPARFTLVEMGPGDGTLMSDLLRATRLDVAFMAAADIWLVEVSAPLRDAQKARLGDGLRWASDLAEIPQDGPLLLIANELLDCLPARQFIRTERGWAERMVGLDAAGELTFGLRSITAEAAGDAKPGALREQSAAQEALGSDLGGRVASQGGAALLIDYGRDAPGHGDTLQALKAHRKVDPLACPGEADLTVHADFPAVLGAARSQGAATAQVLGQGEFLTRLGIEARASALVRASPDKAEQIGRQLDRLTAPDQMGTLFKAACLHSPGLTPPGFEETR